MANPIASLVNSFFGSSPDVQALRLTVVLLASLAGMYSGSDDDIVEIADSLRGKYAGISMTENFVKIYNIKEEYVRDHVKNEFSSFKDIVVDPDTVDSIVHGILKGESFVKKYQKDYADRIRYEGFMVASFRSGDDRYTYVIAASGYELHLGALGTMGYLLGSSSRVELHAKLSWCGSYYNVKQGYEAVRTHFNLEDKKEPMRNIQLVK